MPERCCKKRRATSVTPEAAPHTHPRQTARDERRICREANESREFLARHPAGRSCRPRRSSLRRRQCARRAEPPRRATTPTPGRRSKWKGRRSRRARRARFRSRSPSRPPRWCVRRPHDSRARRDARTPAANLVLHFFSVWRESEKSDAFRAAASRETRPTARLAALAPARRAGRRTSRPPDAYRPAGQPRARVDATSPAEVRRDRARAEP